MVYRREVRCRFCYEAGHNVKSCKNLEEHVKQNKDGYTHRIYHKYFDSEGNKKAAPNTKKCSYCKEMGHTKRTCETKLEDLINNIQTNKQYRKDFYSFLKDSGIGVGSLINIYNKLFLVTDVVWDNIVCGMNDYSTPHVKLQSFDGNGYQTYSFDDYTVKTKRGFVVESSVDNVGTPPKDWFEGKNKFYKDYHGRVTNPFNEYRSPF